MKKNEKEMQQKPFGCVCVGGSWEGGNRWKIVLEQSPLFRVCEEKREVVVNTEPLKPHSLHFAEPYDMEEESGGGERKGGLNPALLNPK